MKLPARGRKKKRQRSNTSLANKNGGAQPLAVQPVNSPCIPDGGVSLGLSPWQIVALPQVIDIDGIPTTHGYNLLKNIHSLPSNYDELEQRGVEVAYLTSHGSALYWYGP